jgi:hypothetical protein
LKSPQLNESTLKDICDELSNRSLNFMLIANYYDAADDEKQPIISFGVRKQDLSQAIGMLETSKAYLISEFTQDNDVEYRDEDEDENGGFSAI